MRSKLVALQLAAIVMACVLSSCGGGSGASRIVGYVPDGDYFMLMGYDTIRLFSSSAFDKMMELIAETGSRPEDYFERMSEQWEDSSIDWMRLDTALLMISEDPREMLVFLRSKGFEINKVIDFIEDEQNGDIKKKEKRGQRYWLDKNSKGCLIELEGGLLMAEEEVIEDAIEIRTGQSKRLVDDPDFRDALSLTDLNSTVYVTAWGVLDKHTRGVKEAFRIIEDDEEVIEKFDDAMDDLEATGAAIWFDDGFEIRAKALFSDEDSAVFAESYLKETLEKLQHRVVERRRFFRYIAPNIDPSLPEEMVGRIVISRSGPVVQAGIDIDDIDPLIELAKAGLEANRKHEKTLSTIQDIGTALMIYQMDYNSLPAAANVEALLAILAETTFYSSDMLSAEDGWGFPLVYEYGVSETGAMSYTITSYGADGKPGPETAPDESGLEDVTRYVEDYVYSNRSWVKNPKY